VVRTVARGVCPPRPGGRTPIHVEARYAIGPGPGQRSLPVG